MCQSSQRLLVRLISNLRPHHLSYTIRSRRYNSNRLSYILYFTTTAVGITMQVAHSESSSENNQSDSRKHLNPLVLAGPSGAGKGTIIKALMDKYPTKFGFSVSHTTRAPRPGEEDGVHYHFVEKSKMENAINNDEFIEYAHVHTNIYGTSKLAVENVSSKGKICILDIDIQGVQLVKKSGLECKYIFISPPSISELEKRLRGRGTETEEKIQIRLKNAIKEMEFGHEAGNFDAVIINDDLETALSEIESSINQWYGDKDILAHS